MKAIDMLSANFNIRDRNKRERGVSTGKVSLTTFNEDDCVLSVCDLLSVSFAAVCASAF